MQATPPVSEQTAALVSWFRTRKRSLPWRNQTGAWGTWVSEIMLQQTRVEAVIPYWTRFMERFPTPESFAAADEEEVLRYWAGLGYYRRARMLHQAAQMVVKEGGDLPVTATAWQRLPGVGGYASAAIASLVHGEAIAVVDGNVKRVAARQLSLEHLAGSVALHRAAEEWAQQWMDQRGAASAGELNEALMEWGATICTPRNPRCDECPAAASCTAKKPTDFPRPGPKKKWTDLAIILGVAGNADACLLVQRHEGWNTGMFEPPSLTLPDKVSQEPMSAVKTWQSNQPKWGPLGKWLGTVRHTITHHRIQAHVHRLESPPDNSLVNPETVPLTGLARKALRLLIPVFALTLPIHAQEKVATAVMVTTAPVIDGQLDEVVWQEAEVITDFTEVTPNEGDPAHPVTEVRILRTNTHLYFGFTCHEPDPPSMVLQQMKRDAFLREDDRVEIVLDTFHDGKNAYFFQVSALGSRGDALVGANGKSFNKQWDAFWKAKVKINEDSWTVEIAIPFQTLSSGDSGTWGLNLERYRGSNRTKWRWSEPLRRFYVMTPSLAGNLNGMGNVNQGLGLEVRPYVKAKRLDAQGEESSFEAAIGGEFDWWFTPQLKASLTFNTDFAETEIDDRKVNLTQYSLFYPEKRNFFLEDSTRFAFGASGGWRGGGSVIPYYSRAIGLSDGDEVPIQRGFRLTGRVGDLDLGLLTVQTGLADADAEGTPETDGEFIVFRPNFNLNDQTSVGALLTFGNPDSYEKNLVTGFDWRHSNTDWFPGMFSWNSWIVRSDDEESGDIGGAAGARAGLRLSDWQISTSAVAAMGRFHPGLGYVRRAGQGQWRGSIRWEPRPNSGDVRKFTFDVNPTIWLDSNWRVMSHSLRLGLFEIEWHDGTQFEFQAEIAGDRVTSPVFTPGGVAVAQGWHDWAGAQISWETPLAAEFAWETRLGSGSWYDGIATHASVELSWRPDVQFRGALDYTEIQANLEAGSFASRQLTLNADWYFSPEWNWQNLIQYDNQSDNLGLQSRMHWMQEDGREMFLVINTGWQEEVGSVWSPTSSDFAVKLVYALRF